ncbi:MAG TPA: biopolymer transporter ExbD [Kiritimatiellia bacterium]|nr:biopolymer transporter ExbD [Kiritimatiellia bacterium]HMO99455.1 biopolymer transporter ExbD [Kiritimatiellia bacterium]HMP97257.1 biopolymer transporter ExbD [Kiritimatiellia bacterium]
MKKVSQPTLKVDMTPMIDCVFLLLIFFMVSSTMHRQEADISFALPGTADQSEPVQIPDEQIIEIMDDGTVLLNDLKYDSPNSRDMPELLDTLIRFKATADANKVEAMITIAPSSKTRHQRVVDVLNACAAAKIQNVTFATEDDA